MTRPPVLIAALTTMLALPTCSGSKGRNGLVGGAGDGGGPGTGGGTGGATGGSGGTGGTTPPPDAGTTGRGGSPQKDAAPMDMGGTGGSGTGERDGGTAGTGGMDASLPHDTGVDAPIITEPKGPLRVDTVNPRYFTDGSGKAIYLVGSHTWQTLKDRSLTDPPPPFDYNGWLDFLVAHNHNFFRLWTWEKPHSWNNNTDNLQRFFQPFAWKRTGPGNANDGKPKFDLTQLDQAYFDRIRTRVMAAGSRGIYVAITLFNGWDVQYASNTSTGGFPYGAGNNVNGIASGERESQTLSIAAVTAAQDAYVRKVVDTVNDLDNVLYEIANESINDSATNAWQYHMIDLIKQYEGSKPKKHPVGMTSTIGDDTNLFASNADWIAPTSNGVLGDGRKVVINDTDHSYYWTALKGDGQGKQRNWAWQTFTRGTSPLFMDPYLEPWGGRNIPSGSTPDPYWEIIRNALGYTRRYADRMDLEHAVPSSNLSSTRDCLAYPGHQYLVYQSGEGGFSLTVEAGTYALEWFNPGTGAVAQTGTLTVGAETHSFTPPFSGNAVLFLSK
jgi:hypothetical protein